MKVSLKVACNDSQLAQCRWPNEEDGAMEFEERVRL